MSKWWFLDLLIRSAKKVFLGPVGPFLGAVFGGKSVETEEITQSSTT